MLSVPVCFLRSRPQCKIKAFILFQTDHFNPHFLFKNKHFNTLYRYLMTNDKVSFKRERISTKDKDFLDLDISSVQSDKVIIVIHGLEGSSQSSYIQSLTPLANKKNIDVVAVNLRGCSGAPNLKLSSYHSGKTEDLLTVIEYITAKNIYQSINLVGYSLGGNIVLKFMGEFSDTYAQNINAAVGISVPCDLKSSGVEIDKFSNRFYQKNFLKTLKAKTREKLDRFPEANLQSKKILKARNFFEFDEYFTSVAHGFKDANDYYEKSSSKAYIPIIKKPSLLISALDDPFLSPACYPFDEAKANPNFQLLTPRYGGHVGFFTDLKVSRNIWLEEQIINFIVSHNK